MQISSHYRLIIYKTSDQLIMSEVAQSRGLEKCPVPSTIVYEDFLVFLNVPGCNDPRASSAADFINITLCPEGVLQSLMNRAREWDNTKSPHTSLPSTSIWACMVTRVTLCKAK